VAVAGQPVFAIARPDARQVWVNFAFPDNGKVQVIDTETRTVVQTLEPGRAVLHLEFTPRGEAVWISARDDNRVIVYDTGTLQPVATPVTARPASSRRAARMGFEMHAALANPKVARSRTSPSAASRWCLFVGA
jgi:protein NirF